MSMEICMEQAGQLLMLLPTLERSESHLFSFICFSVVVEIIFMNSLLIVIDLSSFQVTMKNQAVKEYCLNVLDVTWMEI